MGSSWIPFVENINQEAGAINKVASQLTKVTQAQSEILAVLSKVDGVLGNMDVLLPPSVPNIGDIQAGLSEVEGAVGQTLGELGEVGSLAGSCVDGALNAVYGVASDGYGLVGDAMNGLYSINGMPYELMGLSDYYNQARALIDKLGLEKMVADITSSLGCMSDSSMVSQGLGQLQQVTSSLGLNPDGTVPDTYYDQLKTKMLEFGFDNSYAQTMTDSVKEVSVKSAELMATAKTTAQEQIQAAKEATVAATNEAEKVAASFF